MSDLIDQRPCKWCFPAVAVLFMFAIILFYSLGYDTGHTAGHLDELEKEIDWKTTFILHQLEQRQ